MNLDEYSNALAKLLKEAVASGIDSDAIYKATVKLIGRRRVDSHGDTLGPNDLETGPRKW